MLAPAARDARAEGPTFALADVVFYDFETRSSVPISHGTYRYATSADAIVLAYAIGAGEPRAVAVGDFSGPLHWDDLPADFRAHHGRVLKGDAIYAAWNASFDKAIWNFSTLGFPLMQPSHTIDIMVQAMASGLPPDLAGAAQAVETEHLKDLSGAGLIKLFCTPKDEAFADPESSPAEWNAFIDYAKADVAAARGVFLRTRQLPLAEWQEYWALEQVNERGVAVDLELATAAAALAEEDRGRMREEIARLTSGAVRSVDEVAKLTAWLIPRVPAEGRMILLEREEEKDEDGEVIQDQKHALTRDRVELLIAFMDRPEHTGAAFDKVRRVLQLRLYGGSRTPAKFGRMLQQHVDGVLFGQYVFNGAGQTGRMASKGVQVHSLARSTLAREIAAIDTIVEGGSWDDLAAVNPDPVVRQLSLLIRPALVPTGDNVFVWSDWSQIEARILPWLASAEERLNIFREVDADPSVPDLYTRTAAALSRVPVEAVTKERRQAGKVAELACFSADTRVLTDDGIKPIIDVNVTDKLWDGKEWVSHYGVAAKGVRKVVSVDGISLTPDHLIKISSMWQPASALVSNENILYRALAHGLANLPLWRTNSKVREALRTAWRSAPAEQNRIAFLSIIFAKAHLRGASNARQNNLDFGAKTFLVMLISSLISSIVDVFSTALLRVLLAAPRPLVGVNTIITTAAAESAYSKSGLLPREAAITLTPVEKSFSLIWSRSKVGITRSLRWIGSTLTAITNLVTYALPPEKKVSDGRLRLCKNVSMNSKPVYDIVHAGPRNRFTIITNSGALIVHNCGFGGGVGALQKMAAAYGLHIGDSDARKLVDNWRAANNWCVTFWERLDKAAQNAIRMPGQTFTVDRLTYVFLSDYLDGSLLCRLPSGRCITYRRVRHDLVDVEDKDGEVIGKERQLRFSRGRNRVQLYKGILVENVCQSVAADCLRETLVRLEEEGFRTVLHSHDEVVVQCAELAAQDTADDLGAVMRRGFDWSDGLPLMSEETISYRYTKSKEWHLA